MPLQISVMYTFSTHFSSFFVTLRRIENPITRRAMAHIHPVLFPRPRKRKNSPKMKSQIEGFGMLWIRNRIRDPPKPIMPIPIKNNPQEFHQVYFSPNSSHPPRIRRAPQISISAHAIVSPLSLGLQLRNVLGLSASDMIDFFKVFFRLTELQMHGQFCLWP